jgi:hypothetical protein
MIMRLLVFLALVFGAGTASAQEAACTHYKVNASVLPISRDAGGGGNIGALEDGDIACVTRQQKVDGSDWGFVFYKLEKSSRKSVNGWATLRYMVELSPTEAAEALRDVGPLPPATAPPPAATGPPRPAAAGDDTDAAIYERLSKWASANAAVVLVVGAGFALAAVSLLLFAVRRKPRARTAVVSAETATRVIEPEPQSAVIGWLEMLDSNATRYQLSGTDVRIGRELDNDVRLQNDSISRHHALVHFSSSNRRFVITDLGAGNGVIINNVRQKKHELSDGDLVQLGEVRMRFRANTSS